MASSHEARVYLKFEAKRSPYDLGRVWGLIFRGASKRRPQDKAGQVIVTLDIEIPDDRFVGSHYKVKVAD